MNIAVEYKDRYGIVSNTSHSLTILAFAKHLGFAGMGYAPRPQKIIRSIAMFFHYCYYIQCRDFNNDKFSEPPIQLSDPTEKAQFSNLAGKAIADFLSKRIDGSIFTVNYEAAMKLLNIPISGSRPDLLSFLSPTERFAIEAKGYSGTCGDMSKHKTQSASGIIAVNYSVACVSYNLYTKVKCKYHDPADNRIDYADDLFRNLTRNYYKGLSMFLDSNVFKSREFDFQNETFFEVELLPINFNKFDFMPMRYFDALFFYRPTLVLPKRIYEYAENGLQNDSKPFVFDPEGMGERNIYIDNDRVGLQIRHR